MTIVENTTLLTGLPRSGTTLTCALLNEFPDTVALAEPIALSGDGNREHAVQEIANFITTVRHQALTTNEVLSKHINGVIPDNFVEPPSTSTDLRKVLATQGLVRVNKPLSLGFHLIIKHPAGFSALADLLAGQYRLVAQVRHPLAVLAAWQTVDMPVNRGRMPMAEAFSPALSAALAAIPDPLKRQVALLDWLLHTYAEFPKDRVIRYEDLIAAPKQTLARFTPNAREPARELAMFDLSTRYRGINLSLLASELLPIRAIAERFYPDFEESLAFYMSNPLHANSK